MPLYQWVNTSQDKSKAGVIAQMASVVPKPDYPDRREVVIRPRSDADPQTLQALHAKLTAHGIKNFIGCEPHCNTLILPEVRGNDQKILSLLEEGHWTAGQPQVIELPTDNAKAPKATTYDSIKKNSLLLAASFYNLGNAAFVGSGLMRAYHNRDKKMTSEDFSEMMIGVTFALGDVLMTFFGHDGPKNPVIAFSDGLSQHLKAHGVVIPRGAEANPESIHKSGFFHAAHDYLETNIIPIRYLLEVVAGGFTMKSAFKRDPLNPDKSFNGGKLTAGLLLSTGWLSAFLLDNSHAPPFEFKPDDNMANKSNGKKLIGWLSQNPRARLAATASIGNNFATLYGANKDRVKWGKEAIEAKTKHAGNPAEIAYYHNKRHDYLWNVVSSCSFLIGNYMFGLSGAKDKDGGIKEPHAFTEDIITVAANVLANIPDKVRQYAVLEAADYITSIKGVNVSNDEVAKAINAQVDKVRHSPFFRANPSNAPSLSF